MYPTKPGHIFRIIAAGLLMIATAATGALAQKAYPDVCTMTVSSDWLDDFTVTASTEGECGLDDVSLIVTNGTDEVVWSASYSPGDLFGFADLFNAQEMTTALTDWITTNASFSSTGTLPEWQSGDDGPRQGEFPFYPAENVDQDFYEMTRDLDLLMVCYVQGQESYLCLFQMPDEPLLEPIGYQSFPG